MRDSRLYGVEWTVSVEGLQNASPLMPQLKSKRFEKTKFEKDSFDVIVGNVPFGAYKILILNIKSMVFRIHDYFLAKSMDLLRPEESLRLSHNKIHHG